MSKPEVAPSRGAQDRGQKLKIEFLYFSGCPSHKQALENLKAALAETQVKANIVLVKVNSEKRAEEVGFQGSPSIRINGRDLEGHDDGFSYTCRIYKIDGKPTPIPSKNYILEKLASY